MKYERFIAELRQVADQQAPDVWGRIARSTRPTVVIAFPRWRILLVAATLALILMLPTSVFVAEQNTQRLYAYLQSFGSTEYITLASINY
jgi:hypothetical protein